MFLQNVFGHTKKQAVFSAVLTIAFVLFAVFLIPSYGIMGAILAGINSYIIWWALLLIFAPEIRVLLPLATIRKTALIGVALLLPLLLLRGVDGGLALTLGAVFPIAYVAGLKVMGEIDKSDWDLMNSLLTSIRGRAPETVA
jgi:O-antigen/teichoic acid export membrane protein